ncbi:MAG: hypothetical protein MJ231_00135 [bacterium]|nr:hypothetical protein [bacterium]
MLTINPISFYESKNKNVAFGLLAPTQRLIPAATTALGVLLVNDMVNGDVFVKDVPKEDVNARFEKNINLVPEDKNLVQKFARKYGINGKNYDELRHQAEILFNYLETTIAEDEEFYKEYPGEDTRLEIEELTAEKEAIESYIDFLDVSVRDELKPQEAENKKSIIKEYKDCCKKNDKSYDAGYGESLSNEFYAKIKDDIAVKFISNFVYDPGVYIA